LRCARQQRIATRTVAGDEDEARAELRQLLGGDLTDAGRGAGQDGGLAAYGR
jgi:hypothetical protein